MLEHLEKKVSVDQLEIGMHVVRLDRPWVDTPFLLQGFIISTNDEIELLSQCCQYVYIEAKIVSQRNVLTGIPQQRVQYINKVSFKSELRYAERQFQHIRSTAQDIMESVRIGRAINIKEAKYVVNECVESILRNDDALKWLSHIKNKDDYTAEHSMNVCILSAAFAKHLGFPKHEIERIALCGLLHDVGKAKIPDHILNKPGNFNLEELRVMQSHTTLGKKLLMSAGIEEAVAIDVAYAHHERLNGKGYPRGLRSHQIPFYAKIIAITDTYDAVTSTRCYKSSQSSIMALHIINKEKGTHFDSELVDEFIQCIGVYPPGALVEMSNGEVGVIAYSEPSTRLKPFVLLLLDEKKQAQRLRLIDLKKIDLDSSSQPYSIARELPCDAYGIKLGETVKAFIKRNKERMENQQLSYDNLASIPFESI
ncbi:HD-GYP domain-containing protein [Zooshikella marina]|uniref:HD-GYP domain-containing protein n=1 Tax=Zooshikella ganghwensis TaxID=202772 RepID=UPI001BAEAD71|nr:HD-GYP domain-containing protein [Zooshikella ganghwensis]MBU2709101.1 HD-GYP domain-containing protein [Zooshikella ganghwensis]